MRTPAEVEPPVTRRQAAARAAARAAKKPEGPGFDEGGEGLSDDASETPRIRPRRATSADTEEMQPSLGLGAPGRAGRGEARAVKSEGSGCGECDGPHAFELLVRPLPH